MNEFFESGSFISIKSVIIFMFKVVLANKLSALLKFFGYGIS